MHSALSDVVAEQIRRRRNSLGLTRHDLAKRCKDLGVPELTYASLTNIETGRKENGQRRRLVTVEELATIARALGIPPVLLLFPVGRTQEMELLPGQAVPPGAALAWFTGERCYPSEGIPQGAVDEATGLPEWYANGLPEWCAALDANWEQAAAPVALWRQHAAQVRRWSQAPAEARRKDDGEDVTEAEFRARLANTQRAAEQELQRTRDMMRMLGLTPPALPDELQHVDGGGR